MAESIMTHDLNGSLVPQRKIDGYLNATALAKAYEAATGDRKDVRDWLLTERAKSRIERLSSKTGIPVSQLTATKKGNSKEFQQGTWIHPKLAVNFATWLSPEFEEQVEEWVEKWMLRQASTTLTPEQAAIALYISQTPIKWKGESPYKLEFYEHLYRIWGGKLGKLDPTSHQKPGCVGGLTNQIVYDRAFPEDISRALHTAYKSSTGRKYEMLTEVHGHEKLEKHFETLLPFMRVTPDSKPSVFKRLLDMAYPPEAVQLELFDLMKEIFS